MSWRYAITNCSPAWISRLLILLACFASGCPEVQETDHEAATVDVEHAQVSDVEHAQVSIDLSPDGKTVLFSSAGGDLFLLDMETRTATRLTSTSQYEYCPSFSPNGQKVVFAAPEADDMSKPSHLFVMELADLSVTQLTSQTEQSDTYPRFTPDGAQIVFARAYRHRPYSLGGWTWDSWDVCRMHADGSNVERLTSNSYYQLSRIAPESNGTLYFAADLPRAEPQMSLFRISEAEELAQIVPSATDVSQTVNVWASEPVLSHKGDLVALISDAQTPFWYDVIVCNKDGSNRKPLVGQASRYNQNPCFFPDDESILFLAGTTFNSHSRPIFSLWQVSLSGQVSEIASADLFTDPEHWLSVKSLNAD